MVVPPQPVRKPGTKAPRPRDAATLIIYRRREKEIEVLMGNDTISINFCLNDTSSQVAVSTPRTAG